jgi:hypothetical protein
MFSGAAGSLGEETGSGCVGPSEAMHFQTWHDKAGNTPNISDPAQNLSFPNLNGGIDPNTGATSVDGITAADLFQTNLIMPEPTVFLDPKLGPVSILRPASAGLLKKPMRCAAGFSGQQLVE